jgi:hypothetical protein
MQAPRRFPEMQGPTGPPAGHGVAEDDLIAILCESSWLPNACAGDTDPGMQHWLARAAQLLGPQAVDRAGLASLLSLIFEYDAAALMANPTNQFVLTRTGARQVIRELAKLILDGPEIDSDSFKEIIERLKLSVPFRSRDLFLPIRLALAGRAGEGELDRVVLLLDSACKLNFVVPVKGAHQRMLEFCAALD